MSNISYRFRRGWFSDPEDWHGNYRMQVALALLKSQGIEPTWKHGNEPINEWCDFGRIRHICADNCKVIWDEWVTDAIFDSAYQLANEIQTERGNYHQQQAYNIKKQQGNILG